MRVAVEEYVSWFLTTSNVVAAVAAGRETLKEAEAWNRHEAEILFAGKPQLGFIFGGPIWFQAGRSGHRRLWLTSTRGTDHEQLKGGRRDHESTSGPVLH